MCINVSCIVDFVDSGVEIFSCSCSEQFLYFNYAAGNLITTVNINKLLRDRIQYNTSVNIK
jgi:hypothetical protein